jgi:phosphoglycolate phosphatase-like HAD superfamily hydrolase
VIPEVCIFGFGNVLFDTKIAYGNGLKRAFGSMDDVYDPSDFDEFFQMSLQGLFGMRYREHPCRYREFVAEFLRGFEEKFHGCVPFPETAETVKELHGKGTVLGIVSEYYENEIRDLLEKHGIDDCFKSVVGFERTFLRRPDPYSLNLCLKELNADSGTAVYVGGKSAALNAADNANVMKIKLDRSGIGVSDSAVTDLTGLLL